MREMKDSGIEWIGEFPKHWEISKFKYAHFGLNVGESIDKEYWSDDDSDSIFYTAGLYPIRSSYNKFPHVKKTTLQDLLMSRNGTPYVYLPNEGALYTDHIIRAKIKDDWERRYLSYCLQRSIEAEVVDTVSIATWSASIWNNQFIPAPNIDTQIQISDFLDSKCAEIDSITADIQKEIELLQEYRKSVISEAVTKGLDSNVEMKDSGFQYWKTIPSNWTLADIKYVFEIVKRIAGKEGFDVLAVTQKGIKIKDISNNEGQIADSYTNYQLVFPGDFVMNHMDLLTGWVDCSCYFGVTSPDYRVFRLRNKKNCSNSYYKYVLQHCYSNKVFYSLGQGVSNLGRWRLQTDAFNEFLIPVPPMNEQESIAIYLDSKCSEIDSIIEDKQKQLDTLAEYRKSLIYEYVTGKKEVPAV